MEFSRNSNRLSYFILRRSFGQPAISSPTDRSIEFSADCEDEDEPSPDNDYYLFIIHGLAWSWSESVVAFTDDYVRSLIANKEYHFMGLLINIWY